MYSFRLSAYADQDIYEIIDYTIDVWDMDQALCYVELIDLGRERIQKSPYLETSKEREELAKGCRSYRVEHHYFFYRVNEEDKAIEIARILHKSRHFPIHVSDEFFPE